MICNPYAVLGALNFSATALFGSQMPVLFNQRANRKQASFTAKTIVVSMLATLIITLAGHMKLPNQQKFSNIYALTSVSGFAVGFFASKALLVIKRI